MLVPTRELALQTSAIVKEIGKHTGVQCMVSRRTYILRAKACVACVLCVVDVMGSMTLR